MLLEYNYWTNKDMRKSTKKEKGVNKMANITFEITKHIGVISESSRGWTKELNLVSWNNRDPKYDIREWDPDHEKMGKGVTFSEEEVTKLKELLNDIDGL